MVSIEVPLACGPIGPQKADRLRELEQVL